MPGPKTPEVALRCARQAIANENILVTRHAQKRMVERDIEMDDVETAIQIAEKVITYSDVTPRYGGTCWRVFGPDRKHARKLAIGLEIFSEANRSVWIALCTVIDIDD